MCRMNFVTYYKLLESRRLSLALVVRFLLLLFCQAVGSLTVEKRKLSFNVGFFFNVLLVVMHNTQMNIRGSILKQRRKTGVKSGEGTENPEDLIEYR